MTTSALAPPCAPLPHPPAPRSRRSSASGATRGQLVEAARLGAVVAAADLAALPHAGKPDVGTPDVGAAYASWRRLRRRAGRQSRQLLRVAFDTGYGQAMQTAMHPLTQAGGPPA